MGVEEAGMQVGPSPWADLHPAVPRDMNPVGQRSHMTFNGSWSSRVEKTQEVILSAIVRWLHTRPGETEELQDRAQETRALQAQGMTQKLSLWVSWLGL